MKADFNVEIKFGTEKIIEKETGKEFYTPIIDVFLNKNPVPIRFKQEIFLAPKREDAERFVKKMADFLSDPLNRVP